MSSGMQLSERRRRAPGGAIACESSTTIARSIAIVCRNLAHEASPLLSIGRFELVRTLGRGGNGIVYEAFDRKRRERVALKVLHERGPSYLYRLKQEFRALAQLRHPSLVALHELFVERDDAYFTMELIAGSDFLTYVHQLARSHSHALSPVRDALVQLCEGVHALHRAGTLHRDLKPSNVLVTGAGRVALLDFGLAGTARESALGREGTPGYMAPEQALGAACEASDWFGFGCMLRRTVDVLAARQPASDLQPLRVLADALLHAEASARPGFSEIMAALRRASSPPIAPLLRTNRHDSARSTASGAELAKLAEAFQRSRTEALVVVVRGEPGSGKSALLQRFVGSLESPPQPRPVLVLRGRCYERESLPYKGFDSAIDELSRVLIGLPDPHAAREPLADAAALVALFPVLGRVPFLQSAPERDHGARHPLEVRARGFAALRALLARLAAERAVVLCLDDMQWSDADSGRLLGALLCEEDTPSMLVVVTVRPEHAGIRSALDELHDAAELAPRPVCVEEIELAAPVEQRAPQLEAELARRLAELPAAQLAILELASLAGRPLPTRLLAAAARLGIEHHAHVKALREAGCLRMILRGDDEWLELEHGRVAELVLGRCDEPRRVELHRRLIAVLEAEPGATGELLIEHHVGAGQPAEAARCAMNAADAAFAALAFARAARLYERALVLGRFSAAQRAELHRQHAVALAHAGRGVESAEAYREAARSTADPLEAAPLEQRAADHLMRNGRYREGEASLRRAYRALGVRWPKSRSALVLGIVRLLLPAPLRRLGQRRVSTELHRLRAELIAAATRGFESYDVLRAIHNSLLCFDEAEQLADPRWQARVKGSRGILRSLSFPRDARGLRELEEACASAAPLGDPTTSGELELQRALALYVRGRSREALEAGNRSVAHLRGAPRGAAAVALHGAMALVGSALLDLGRLRDARRHWHALTHAARLHSDLMTIVWVHTHPVQLAALFAAEERARSEAVLERAAALCAAHPRYYLVSWANAACRVEHASYWGEPHEALDIWRREQAVLFGPQSWVLNGKARMVRARACLLAASALSAGPERAALLRRASIDAALLRWQQNPLDRGMGALLRASVALLRGRPERAIVHLEAARALFDGAEARLLSAAARYCQGALVGGEQGAALQGPAFAAFAGEGVIDPRRYIAWIASGFRLHLMKDGR